MSELLQTVLQHSFVAEAHRIDPHVFCRASLAERGFWFSVTDDGWYGWFTAQYPRTLNDEQIYRR